MRARLRSAVTGGLRYQGDSQAIRLVPHGQLVICGAKGGGGIANEAARVRNPGVHRERVDRESAMRLRDRLMGVGCFGEFVQLAKVRTGGLR
jgi:hypothetical protein